MKEKLLLNLIKGLYKKQKLSILTEKEIQQAYLYLLKRNQIQAIKELSKPTNIPPSRKVSESAQKYLLNQGKVGAVKEIQKATGIRPRFSLEAVRKSYDRLNRVRTCHLLMPNIIMGIHDITGMKANKKTIMKWYDPLMKNGEITNIRIIEKMTGVKSDYKQEIDFLLKLRSGNFKESKKLYKRNRLKFSRKYGQIEDIFKRMEEKTKL